MDVQQTADWINVLGDFCGMRDVPALTREQLKKRYGWEQADVMVLFGGSILCGAEVLARAMQEEAAKRFLIVGGEGHTTESLRQKIHAEFPHIETAGRSEAECFAAYLWEKWGGWTRASVRRALLKRFSSTMPCTVQKWLPQRTVLLLLKKFPACGIWRDIFPCCWGRSPA